MQRFTDFAEEPQRMLTPIKGYEYMSLVPLEQAADFLVSYVPEVARMVWTVKQNCTKPADNLTTDQSASIMLYILD
ncbi:unnamed protein product [Rotaria sp. Silwood2]|nr:unnamed protein product [Rotaria sp. Silwood2]CAF4021693.1 unnamed protein product [Rotaria sp. Silwood2]